MGGAPNLLWVAARQVQALKEGLEHAGHSVTLREEGAVYAQV